MGACESSNAGRDPDIHLFILLIRIFNRPSPKSCQVLVQLGLQVAVDEIISGSVRLSVASFLVVVFLFDCFVAVEFLVASLTAYYAVVLLQMAVPTELVMASDVEW
jgi:hypothetical protein